MEGPTLTVTVDTDACAGHGRCYDLAPEVFAPDDDGFPVVIGSARTAEERANLDIAERNCPERAVLVRRTTDG